MKRAPMLAAVVALAAVSWFPCPVLGQAPGSGPQMTPAETEAYQMSLEMAFTCNPQRHRSMPEESESLIRRATGDLAGSASYVRSAEGTFLVLEGYDENQAGHCLVLAWFGGDLSEGRHAIRRLSMEAMEEEVGVPRPSFFTFSAVRSPAESATLVVEGGSLEIEAMSGSTVSGTFELRGFTISSQQRVDDVVLEGSFTALARDP